MVERLSRQLMEAARAVKAAERISCGRGGPTSPKAHRPSRSWGTGLRLAPQMSWNMLDYYGSALRVGCRTLLRQYADIPSGSERATVATSADPVVPRTQSPVMLKRGMAATIEEAAAGGRIQYSRGNKNVMFVSVAVTRTLRDPHLRNTFIINAIAAVKELSHLPWIIIADPFPCHCGKASLVNAVTRAAITLELMV